MLNEITRSDQATSDGISERLSFTTDLVILGYLATLWADSGSQFGCCAPGWGAEMRHRPIIHGSDRWVATREPMMWHGVLTLGLHIVRHVNAMNGGKARQEWWVPFEAFKTVRMQVEGMELPGAIE